jgi:hypothetical protein
MSISQAFFNPNQKKGINSKTNSLYKRNHIFNQSLKENKDR